MAKRQNEQPQQRLTAKVRYFELEASDETVQKALDTFARMHNPPEPPARSARRLLQPPGDVEPTLFDREEVTQGEAPKADEDVPLDESKGQRRKRGDGDPKDRNAGIEPVGDIDFVPTGKTSLKALFGEKAPASDMDQILVIGYFLHHTLALSKFGAGHILTGFKHVNKPVPKDLKQTIRNMRKEKAWLKFTDLEDIRLTTEGDNHVEHELGQTDEAGEK